MMSADNTVLPPASDDASDAAKWRALCSKVKECLADSSNGFASVGGGEDNLYVSVQSQRRGISTMELKLYWMVENEQCDDFNAAMQPERTDEQE